MARPTAVEVKLLLSENIVCGSLGGVRRPPPFRDNLAVPHDHQAVQGVELAFGVLDEPQYRRRRDPLRLGRGARERERRRRGRHEDEARGQAGEQKRAGSTHWHLGMDEQSA